MFLQPWWLDAVSGGATWHPYVHLATRTVWPLYVRRKWGLPYATLPPLTPRLGWYAPPGGPLPTDKPPFRLLFERHRCAPDTGMGPFLARYGYRMSQSSHYRIPSPIDLPAHWRDAVQTLSKRQIKKAQQQLTFVPHTDAATLHALMQRSLQRHGAGPATPLEIVERVVQSAIQHQQGAAWSAIDAHGNVHAAVLLAWDARTVYYIAGGMDERQPSWGGSRWLLWKGIEWAAATGKAFELGGGTDPGVGRLYASLGGQVAQDSVAVLRFW